MSEYIISGGVPLVGDVTVSGAKNAVLPILCACLLVGEGTVTLTNCPDITDVLYTLEILRVFGCKTTFEKGTITVNAADAHACEIPCALVGKMRSTALFLGAAAGRFKKAEQCMPGGCELGARPIDMHLSAFAKMGLDITDDQNRVICRGAPHGTDVFLRYPSVGATENIMLAAACAAGTTTVTNAAREPEISALAEFINAAGGRISGAGGGIIVIEGVEKLHGASFSVMGDRIEAATYLAAGLATNGSVTVNGVNPAHLAAVCEVMRRAGGHITCGKNCVSACRAWEYLRSPGRVETAPYPAFPTDAQSIVMAMLLTSRGRTVIHEGVFNDRLRVAREFMKMGADIEVLGQTAVLRGTERLHGAQVAACDLRSGAALTIAALGAQGESVVYNTFHIERGYGDFDTKLKSLNGQITKTGD